MTAAPAGGGLAEVLALLAKATPGPLVAADETQDIGRGMLMHYSVVRGADGKNIVRLGYTDPNVHAFAAAVNYLRSHGEALAELIEAATELRQRQRDYLADPKDQRQESKGRLVGIAADRLDAALAKVASNGDTK